MYNQPKSMFDCPPSLTSFITIISHHCCIILIFDHSIILQVPVLLTYSANGPGTVGRHQQWDVPAPTFTFTPRSYTGHSMPLRNCMLPETILIINCPKYERS